ncbi:hypothetical protein GCK72_006558 [Caenorhabditis remanei]|uniref:Uncharacterized protein n=1 Tax=Caenorhabditis remanei TaxID=31234 RepID=A0A6A5HFB8_CAERE|nr:hypothetical protein GCK72_006558 [Caenorhabditis remanei]KAF1766600.1 hypothetical protein GCK72_006558 [Caenorhabditis remanei]
MYSRQFLFLSILVGTVSADFSASFNKFQIDNYGKGINDLLARRDIGPHGSYGGGTHDGSVRTRLDPFILK